MLFEATRFDFEGEEKKKLERVRKFYAAVAETVELRALLDGRSARGGAGARAARGRSRSTRARSTLLVEALGGDVARIAVEIEKLSLYCAGGRSISEDDIAALVPDARSTTIFALVNALGRRDRTRGLEILDTLCREGEYLPLALAFLSTQFRLALVSKESGLRSSQQIQGHFSRAGVPMWSSRAEQIYQTVAQVLERAVGTGTEADLRGGPRPAQRAARRPHRDGTLCSGADAVASALTRTCSLDL